MVCSAPTFVVGDASVAVRVPAPHDHQSILGNSAHQWPATHSADKALQMVLRLCPRYSHDRAPSQRLVAARTQLVWISSLDGIGCLWAVLSATPIYGRPSVGAIHSPIFMLAPWKTGALVAPAAAHVPIRN